MERSERSKKQRMADMDDHKAAAESSEIEVMLEAEEGEAIEKTVLAESDTPLTSHAENQNTEPEAEDDTQTETNADTEANPENDTSAAIAIPIFYSSEIGALPVPEGDSNLPPPISSPKPLATSSKITRRRRGTLRLSQKQKEAAKRHAKNASKRFIMFLISHVGLTCVVVAYSIMGGFIFQMLEASNEKESRGHIQEIRQQHVEQLWEMNERLNIFNPEKWREEADIMLENFQKEIYEAVKDKGWDGSDNVTDVDLQWTYAGSLLYSVTVITTIGYGHLTPKTTWGRVVTMLYALIGIPMTLLCLANIGSFMAHCFRILWKQIVCKPCRNHIRRRSMYLAAKQKASTTAYVANLARQKGLVKAADGTGAVDEGQGYSHNYEGMSDSPAAVHDSTSLLGKSGTNVSPQPLGDGPFLLGFEGLMTRESVSSELHDPQTQSDSVCRVKTPTNEGYPLSPPTLPGVQNSTYTNAEGKTITVNEYPEITITAATVTQPALDPDPEVVPPKKKQPEVVRVPIMVCLIMVAGYIVLGAVLFSLWEDWNYFDSSYFCFITLSTIGFGDIVPGYEHNAWGNQAKRVSCTCYLLFGLALLAMCFELIQSECRQKFITLAHSLGFTVEQEQG